MRWSLFIFLMLICVSAHAFRISRPPTLSDPIDKEQINQLNASLEDIFNQSNGRVSLDIVTTTKSGADNGDLWILNDSGTYKLEFMANDIVRTITP